MKKNLYTRTIEKGRTIPLLQVILLVALVPILAIIIILFSVFLNTLHKSTFSDLNTITGLTLEKVSGGISAELQSSIDVANNGAAVIQSMDSYAEVQPLVENLKNNSSNIYDVYYAAPASGAEESFFASGTHYKAGANYNPFTRSWYTDAVGAKGSLVVSSPYMDVDSGELCVTLSKAVYSGSTLKGVIGVDVLIKGLAAIVEDNRVSESGHLYIVDKDGLFITNEDKNAILKTNYFDQTKDLQNAGINKADYFNGENTINILEKNYYGVAPVAGTPWFVVTDGPTKDLTASIIAVSARLIVVVIIICVLCIFFYHAIAIQLAGIFKYLSGTCEKLSLGDFTSKYKDYYIREANTLSHEFRDFTKGMAALVRDVKNSADKVTDVAHGIVKSNDEIIGSAMNVDYSVKNMTEAVGEENTSIDKLNTTVAEIVSDIDNLSCSIGNQSRLIASSSQAIEEMAKNVLSIGKSTGEVAQYTDRLVDSATENKNMLKASTDEIMTVKEASGTLLEMNKVISSVASQTNLLAMNAAIEAAHAGKTGLGFAVVADEIRKLAETTSKQAKSSSASLKEIQHKIEGIADSSAGIEKSFEKTIEDIQNVSTIISRLKDFVEQEGNGAKDIISSLSNITDLTLNVKNDAESIEKRTYGAYELCKVIEEVSAKVKENIESCTRQVKILNDNSVALKEISGVASEHSANLAESVCVFKLPDDEAPAE